MSLLLKNFIDYKRIMDIILILNDNENMTKTEIKKSLDRNGGTLTNQTVYIYLNLMERLKIIKSEKNGRVCNISLTDKGTAIVKPVIALTNALK